MVNKNGRYATAWIRLEHFSTSRRLLVSREAAIACCLLLLFAAIAVANMSFSTLRLLMLVSTFFTFAAHVFAQSATTPLTPPVTSSRPPRGNGTTSTRPPSVTTSTAPDVLLQVPELHVGRIELVVEKLQADLNLNAKVAGLVQVNAGVQVAVEKVNITIADVDVNLELVVRLGNLVQIVERVFDSLDLNPLLISLISNVTNLVGEVIGAVDGLVSFPYRIP